MLEGENSLIKKAQGGEAASFGDLYDHYSKPIYRYVFLKTSHKSLAEDITHEVFLSAWQNINNYSFQGFPFSSWLYQIARNRVIDHYRTRKELINLDDLEEKNVELVNQSDFQIDQNLTMEKIKAGLSNLPEDQKDVIIMRFINDLSTPEISSIINKSEGAVRLIQHRAIANLKKILND